MAELWALLPAEGAATVKAALDAAAYQPIHRRGGDPRTGDQRRADALTDLAAAALTPTGRPGGRRGGPGGRRGRPGGRRGGPGGPSTARGHGQRPAVHVTVAASTLMHLDDQPADHRHHHLDRPPPPHLPNPTTHQTHHHHRKPGRHREPGHRTIGHRKPGHRTIGHRKPGHRKPGHQTGHRKPSHRRVGHRKRSYQTGHRKSRHGQSRKCELNHWKPDHLERARPAPPRTSPEPRSLRVTSPATRTRRRSERSDSGGARRRLDEPAKRDQLAYDGSTWTGRVEFRVDEARSLMPGMLRRTEPLLGVPPTGSGRFGSAPVGSARARRGGGPRAAARSVRRGRCADRRSRPVAVARRR